MDKAVDKFVKIREERCRKCMGVGRGGMWRKRRAFERLDPALPDAHLGKAGPWAGTPMRRGGTRGM